MKKILFFLMLSTIIICCNRLKVNAETYKFYEAETFPDIFINKVDTSTHTTYYQTARYFRQVGTNEFAYCIEAFRGFYGDQSYNQSNPTNLTPEQLDRITKIAHYGFNYPGHEDQVWYPVTQTMIWQVVVNENDVYFTDTLNGRRTNKYDHMINEIKNLIRNNETVPSFNNQTINLVEGQDYVLTDTNNVLNNYNASFFNISNNKLIITKAKAGTFEVKLNRSDNHYNKPILFYTSNGSQNLVKTGDLTSINASVKIIVKPTNIKIIKIDADTNSTKPSGEAKLIGSEFGIYNTNNELVGKIKIDENNEGVIKNLLYGKYYIKELKAGVGYKLNYERIDFELNEKQTDIKLKLSNQVIKKKIIINKTYGNKNKQIPEANIEFNIFDSNNKLVDTIKTNELGKAEYTLPYGTYTIKQLTTTEGYEFNNPIKIKVIDEKDEVLNLKDYQIEVPDTHKEMSILEKVLSFIL